MMSDERRLSRFLLLWGIFYRLPIGALVAMMRITDHYNMINATQCNSINACNLHKMQTNIPVKQIMEVHRTCNNISKLQKPLAIVYWLS